MLFRAPESHPRSLVKAISWRLVGSMDTFILSWLITGKLRFAFSIAGVETITKILLYYFHERAWAIVPWGRAPAAEPESAPDAPQPVAAPVLVTVPTIR
jgi:uncharacterized membrane protein